MRTPEAHGPRLLRDQLRARHAHAVVCEVQQEARKDYEIAINGLGANILRSGLCAAIASIQRLEGRGTLVLEHIAKAKIPGLEDATAKDLAQRIRMLDTDAYMIATREALQVAVWLKRAVQATSKEPTHASGA